MWIRFDMIHERERIAVFKYRNRHFLFPLETPLRLSHTVLRYSKIFVKKSAFIPLHSTFNAVRISAPLWYGKTRMVSLPDDMFIRFDVIYERDRRTDGPRLHSIAR